MISADTSLREINKYKTLKQSLNNTAKLLLSSDTDIKEIKNIIDKNYTIDDNSSALASRSQNLEKKIKETANTILNKIIPAIDAQIKSLEKQMASSDSTSSPNSDIGSKIVEGILKGIFK